MTVGSWGLLLDLIGVVLLASATARIDFVNEKWPFRIEWPLMRWAIDRWPDDDARLAQVHALGSWAGWSLLAAGFFLQFVDSAFL